MKEFRITRPDMYKNLNCPGHKDLGAREGHYIEAENEDQAIAIMKLRFPNDSAFDLQLWGIREK